MEEFTGETPSKTNNSRPTIAYFCMEIGLDPAIPTYSGGLGILAGDTLRASADLSVPMVGMTLLHRKGYLKQHLDDWGNQSESPAWWYPEEHLQALPHRATITIEGRPVKIRAWRHQVRGVGGYVIPVYFLDASLYENSPWDRRLTDYLYGGDSRYRLCQEALLGIGGMAMLQALGYEDIQVYHMNEGHCALLTLPLLRNGHNGAGPVPITATQQYKVRQRCIFTTHTPVAAGHDQFPLDMVHSVLGADKTSLLSHTAACQNGSLNMSRLALTFSEYVNGVSRGHGVVSQQLFPDRPIASITNGVHAASWTSPPVSRLYDRHIPAWRQNSAYLRQAASIPLEEVEEAHREAKLDLLREVERLTNVRLDPDALTIAFARRATAYKRADLLFTDLERLRDIARRAGPIQVLYAGKAHPHDEHSKAIIRKVFQAAASLKDVVPVLYLEDYDIHLGKLLCGGVDLWLNTPQRPLEASGTSGMKAALNGIPSLSVLDGWWLEGHEEGVTGWAIGDAAGSDNDTEAEALSLYQKLEQVVVPTFYKQPTRYTQIRRSAMSLNGSYFNTHRMMTQYVEEAYGATAAQGLHRRA